MGLELAKILYGGKPPSPVKARITSTTPATYAILLNAEILQASTGAKSDSEWQSARIAEARKRYTDSLRKKGKLESISTDPAGTAYSAASGFSGKIAVLVDAECDSSCESTLGYLKFHPKLKVVGENTAGYFHFGNLGAVYLPNSRVTVMMASDFWKLRNGEYLENIGYSPDVRVRSGQDAMSAAIDFLKTSRSN
jgi:C-terminal processing protease CtpA/Prc